VLNPAAVYLFSLLQTLTAAVPAGSTAGFNIYLLTDAAVTVSYANTNYSSRNPLHSKLLLLLVVLLFSQWIKSIQHQ
jgi:hypothetical protein